VTQAYAAENHYVVNLATPCRPRLVSRTDAIHRYNAVASIELNLRTHIFPADMTKDEVRGIIRAFSTPPVRAKEGRLRHAHDPRRHGHTVAQFYSPS
jgi:hypothetical protein